MRVLVLALSLSAAAAQTLPCKPSTNAEPTAQQLSHWERLKSQPDQTMVLYNIAIRYAGIGNSTKAAAILQKALASDPWLDPSQDPAFKDYVGCPEFQALVSRIQKKHSRVANSEIVATIGPKTLIPEGIAIDSHDGRMYVSSIFHRKIVKLGPDKTVQDFVAEGQGGLLGVLGLRVDPRDGSVWAASERDGQSALYHFSTSGAVLGKFEPKEKGEHLFNDIVVTRAGDVYVTDSTDKSVYKLSGKAVGKSVPALTRISLGDRYYPNGIAVSEGEKTIYIAHAFGIATMDRASGVLTELKPLPGMTISEIDGLYYWKGTLIAIQNGSGGNRIVQFDLSRDGRSITAARLLEWRSDHLQLPTTGAIYDGYFYFMTNTQIDHDNNGQLKNQEELQPVRIARLKLP